MIVDDVVVVDIDLASEGRHLDRLATEANVRNPKAATDQARSSKYIAHLLRRCVRRDVEVLWRNAEQHVSYAATNEQRVVSRIAQSLHDTHRRGVNEADGDAVLGFVHSQRFSKVRGLA